MVEKLFSGRLSFMNNLENMVDKNINKGHMFNRLCFLAFIDKWLFPIGILSQNTVFGGKDHCNHKY